MGKRRFLQISLLLSVILEANEKVSEGAGLHFTAALLQNRGELTCSSICCFTKALNQPN